MEFSARRFSVLDLAEPRDGITLCADKSFDSTHFHLTQEHSMTQPTRDQQTAALQRDWAENPRWKGVTRNYAAADVVRLRGSVQVEHTLARRGAEKLWSLVNTEPFVNTLGALTGNQALQQVKAGLKAIYLSGWQVAGDANSNGEMYPDQSLYSVDSVPKVVRKINNALRRADQITWAEGKHDLDWFAPIVADAEAGFGGPLNAYELMRAMIDAGAAGVHYEDQLASEKKCGHLGGKVLVPTGQFIRTLTAARLAADVDGVPSVLIARTDSLSAELLAYNCSPSFNWRKHLGDDEIARFQEELGALGYKFLFVTLAGFHALNESMFELARGYAQNGMSAYVELQEREFSLEDDGYTATRHQREVGAGYFDEVAQVISGGLSSTLALKGSTEEAQFEQELKGVLQEPETG